jgi:hypothetical protein
VLLANTAAVRNSQHAIGLHLAERRTGAGSSLHRGDSRAADGASGPAIVRDFELYIEDDRYRTPTLMFVQAKDEERVRELAQKKLEEDPRHRGVEVREDGVRLFGLGTMSDALEGRAEL